MPQTRFTKEFQDEAVRLALTSYRSRREVAQDLGVGLSALRHWIDRRREREIDDPPEDRQEDMAAELKRLRRENEILRQEREILKKAAVSSIDQRNSFSQHSARGSKAKGLPWPGVESECNRIEIILAVDGQVRSLGEILA
jgi:transposase